MLPSASCSSLVSWRSLVVCLALGLCVADAGLAATLRGVVTDPDGRPVVAAELHLASPASTRTSVTDGEGRYRFDRVEAGHYRLWVVRDGFRATPVLLTLDADTDLEVPVALQVSALNESLVVSAGHIDATRSTAPASVTVVSGADLAAQQLDTLVDALRQVPGLGVAQSGTRGALTSVFPRGGESDYTLVLIDGIRVNAFGGGFDFAGLAEANVERVEIVRGPQSALFGADAIGGVVHVITRQDGPLRAAGLVEGGNDETAHASGSFSGAARGWTWGGGGDVLESDGLNGHRAASGEIVGNDDFTRRSGSASVGHGSARTRLRGVAHAGSTDRGFPGPFGSDPNGTYPGIDLVSRGETDWRGVSASGDFAAADRVQVRASASWVDLDGRFTSAFGTSDTETRRSAARAQADIALALSASLSAGLETLHERARSTFITAGSLEPAPITRRVIGSFAEVRLEGVNRYLVTAGLRVEHIRRDPLAGETSPFAPRPEFAANTVVSANPKFAMSWFLRGPEGRSGWTRVRASAGTGIRPPDALEIAFTDNPTLAPERSRSLEGGIEQAFGGGALVVEATAFFNRYDDLIVAVGPAFGDVSRYRTDNISNARAWGAELGVSARAGASLEIFGGYTFLDTEILAVDGGSGQAPPPFEVGDPLIRRPRHRGTLRATLAGSRWSAFARMETRGRVLDIDPTFGAFGGTLPGPGYTVIDAGASLRVWRGIEVLARVTNLLDRQYEEVVGFPALGRSVMAGVRVAAGR